MKNDLSDNVIFLMMNVVTMIRNLFVEGNRVTIVIRNPAKPEATILLSEDDPKEVAAAVNRIILSQVDDVNDSNFH